MRRPALLAATAAACSIGCFILMSSAMATESRGAVVQDCAPAYCFPSIIDDDAPNDPGPGDPTVSDPLENGSVEHPFDSVQEAMDIMLNPCSVILMPGTYHDRLPVPGLGCDIVGSGKEVTIVESSSPDLLGAELQQGWPGVLTVRDLTLKNGNITISGDETATVAFENVEMQGVLTYISTLSPTYPPSGMMEIGLRSISGAGSGFTLVASGAAFNAAIDSVNLTGGGFSLIGYGVPYRASFDTVAFDALSGLESYGTEVTVEMINISAPSGGVALRRGSGGSQTLSVRDSTLGELSSQSLGYWFRGTVQNVHFTGRGITASEPLMELSVEDCIFDAGGMDLTAANSPDVGTGVDVGVKRAVFKDEGIQFSTGFFTSFFGASSHTAFLTVDSSSFAGDGLQAGVRVGEIRHDLGTGASVTVTNSTFDSPQAGARIAFELPDFDSDPNAAHGSFGASFVNNTSHGCQDGIVVQTNPHVPGQHSITTLIQNNVIVAGVRGVSIHGTDDQQITVASNDIYGSSESDYSGDLADQTGLNGNISAEPFLADPAHHDLRLTSASPCIDTGTSGPQVPAKDHDGQTRPLDGDGSGTAEADMGAFEFAPTDLDGDGYFAGDDCDDTNEDVHPGAADLPGNTLDEDCSGEAVCSPASFYKTHGLYVRCVSAECSQLVDAGLVTQAQCDALTDEAGRSNVGRRQRFRQPPVPTEP